MLETQVPRPSPVRALAEMAAMAARRARGERAVVQHQLERVREVVRHAALHVPAYAGVLEPRDADRLRELGDLTRLPVVDKDHFLRRDPDDRGWVAPGVRAQLAHTSGTSGQPFAVPWTPWAQWRNAVQRLWMMHAMRIRPLDRQVAVVVPFRLPTPERARPPAVGPRRLLATRRLVIPDDPPPAAIATRVSELQPHWLTGEPHTLIAVGEALTTPLRPRTVTTFGVALGDALRAELTALYGTPPLDIYGSSEAGQMAWQCRKADLYHVNHETVVFEVVDDLGRPQPPGATGDLLVTGLLNALLPMIRYRIGDGAAWADRPCACGHRLPALTTIAGRVFDWLVDDQGRRVAPQRLWISALVPDRFRQVRRYRMAQDGSGRVVVELVTEPEFRDDGPALVRQRVQSVLGAGTPVEVRLVEEIVLPAGQRFRQFTSKRRPS